tara:strand:+ start:115 stop:567 length:453 start_codon:yes stop_codon:yes gene_type:complete
MDKMAHILNRKGIDKIKFLIQNKSNAVTLKNVPTYQSDIKDKIINLVCDYYRVNVDDVIQSRNRLGEVIMAKYMSIYFISIDYPELHDLYISKMFNCHRTTVLHGKKKISELIEFDKVVINETRELRKIINKLYDVTLVKYRHTESVELY